MGYSRKKNKQERLRTYHMEFPGVLKKENVKFQGTIKKETEFPRVLKEKLIWKFHGSCFLTLEFPRGVTKLC